MNRSSPRSIAYTGVEVRIRLETADFAIVGPDEGRERLWTIRTSAADEATGFRPVTVSQSKAREERPWQQITGRDWRTS